MKATILWLESHRDWSLEFLRVVLAGILIWKGFEFVRNIDVLLSLIGLPGSVWAAGLFAHYIVIAHIVGGLMLTIGLLTRVVIAAQIPILSGATILLFQTEGLSSNFQFTMLVFFLLIVFLFYGGGRLSVDGITEGRKSA